MVIITINTPAVYGVGDLHYRFDELMYFIKIKDITDCTFVVNGDVGLGFHNTASDIMTLKRLDKLGEERNMNFVLFRGNHDDPDRYINAEHYYPGLKRVYILQDYTIVSFVNDDEEQHNMLVVGGATSIDRIKRITDMRTDAFHLSRFHKPALSINNAMKKVQQTYWDGELPVYNESFFQDLSKSGIRINSVATHTAPSFCFPHDKDGIRGYLLQDVALERDLNTEREVMDCIYNRLTEDGHPIEKWMYGHYHTHHVDYIDDVAFILVDEVKNGRVDTYRLF